MKLSERECSNCVFEKIEFSDGEFAHHCRRHPPKPMYCGDWEGIDLFFMYTPVEPHDWCGEHMTEDEYERGK